MSGNEFEKPRKICSFVIVYQAGERDYMKAKIHKICESFNCQKFELPQSKSDFKTKLIDLEADLATTKSTLNMTKTNIE